MSYFWLSESPLILASKSQSRRALLASADIPIEVVASTVDERAIENGLENTGGEKSQQLWRRQKQSRFRLLILIASYSARIKP